MSKKHYFKNIKGKAVVKNKSYLKEKNYLKDIPTSEEKLKDWFKKEEFKIRNKNNW